MRVLVVYVAAFACNAGACVVVLIVSRRFSLHLLCKKLCNWDIFDNFMKKVFRKCSLKYLKSHEKSETSPITRTVLVYAQSFQHSTKNFRKQHRTVFGRIPAIEVHLKIVLKFPQSFVL